MEKETIDKTELFNYLLNNLSLEVTFNRDDDEYKINLLVEGSVVSSESIPII